MVGKKEWGEETERERGLMEENHLDYKLHVGGGAISTNLAENCIKIFSGTALLHMALLCIQIHMALS